jgi:hypothetical protein
VTVKRHHRFVGGEHDGQRTPIWVWQHPITSFKEVRLPIVPKPRVTVHDDGDTLCSISEGPEHETHTLRTVPLTRGTFGIPIYFECWAIAGLPDGDARELALGALFEGDRP